MKRLVEYHAIFTILFLADVELSKFGELDQPTSPVFDPVSVARQILVFLPLLFFCVLHRRVLLQQLRCVATALPIIALATISSLWSITPGFTFRRSLLLWGGTLVGYYFGTSFNPARLIRLYRISFGIMITLSLAAVALFPAYAISHGANSGDWRGCFPHKNRLGTMMALVIITFIIIPTARLSLAVRGLIATVALVLLYKAHSGTSVVLLLLVIMSQMLWVLAHQRKKNIVAVFLMAVPFVGIAIAIIASVPGILLGLLGKDKTFTGRTPLWAGVIHAISRKPLLGYGYLSFWKQPGGIPSVVRSLTSFQAPHAHDGYLDLVLHFGAVGLVLFMVFFLGAFWFALREVRETNTPESRWFISFIVFMGILNTVESQFIEPFFFFWTGLVALFTSFQIDRAHRLSSPEGMMGVETEQELVAG